MEINLNENIKDIITFFLLILLPLIIILAGVAFGIQIAWYFILAVTWFGMGVIFYSALKD